MSLTIKFERYISDGPGFAGEVLFRLAGAVLRQTCGGEVVPYSLVDVLPTITGVEDMPAHNAASVFNALDLDTQEYVGSPTSIDPDRVKLLDFADGESGFLILYGEPCYFTLVHGKVAYECGEGVVADRRVLGVSPFPLLIPA
jgi:hypothetical protein